MPPYSVGPYTSKTYTGHSYLLRQLHASVDPGGDFLLEEQILVFSIIFFSNKSAPSTLHCNIRGYRHGRNLVENIC